MRDTLPGGILPLELEDPRMVGGLPLLGRVGAGGMGTVYLADAPDGRRVAIKVIHPRLAGDRAFRARFKDEVVLAGRVASFCTAGILGHGEDRALHPAGLPYMISEYIGGLPLARRVHESGPLSPSDLHGVAVGVVNALAAIHAAGLVHRDLKPSNVVLTLSGPRVIDFGIARALDASTSWTTTGTVLGTPGWMAPEVLTGGTATPAADIFGWGCLMAYAGTGRLPFGEGQALDVARRVVQEDPDLTGLSGTLVPLIRAALHKRPENRPSATDLMMRLVGQPIAMRPTMVQPPIIVEQPRKVSRRALLAGAGLSAVGLAGAAFAFWPSSPAPVEPVSGGGSETSEPPAYPDQKAAPPKKRRRTKKRKVKS
ncbi:MAG: serine/threonine-protein kinase [Streptosporangiaceae bacterium]